MRDVGWKQQHQSATLRSGSTPGAADVIRLEEQEQPAHQQDTVSLTLNDQVRVTVDEVKVVNSSCVELSWTLIGQQRARQPIDWLRVKYWSERSRSRPSSLLVDEPLTTSHYVLCGLSANTRYAVCIQPVYASGLLGRCSRTHQMAPASTTHHHQHGK